MTDQELLDDAHEVLIQLAPERNFQPLYIVEAGELAGLHTPPDSMGWAMTAPFFDRNIADRLGDRYIGPGNLIVIDLRAIEQNFPGESGDHVRTIAIHELAHCLPALPVRDIPDTAEVREIQNEMMQKSCALPVPKPGAEGHYHSWTFIRRCCHLLFRASMLGIKVPPHAMTGEGWQHDITRYMLAAMAECVEMQNATFAEIEATEPPALFMDYWQRDLTFYHDFYKRESA